MDTDRRFLDRSKVDCVHGWEALARRTGYRFSVPAEDSRFLRRCRDVFCRPLRGKSPWKWLAGCVLPLLLLLVVPAVNAQFNYTNNNGAITITRYTGTNLAVVIPSTIDGLPVTSIGDQALLFPPVNITNVVIPEGVTNIGYQAFMQCGSMRSITIPDSVANIGNGAFQECYSLSNVRIDNTSITNIGDGVFASCANLTSLTIPERVTSIGNGSFSGCGFPTLTIPSSITSLGPAAFANCTRLTTVTIPDSVVGFGDHAFAYCSVLTNVTIGNGVTNLGDYAFYVCYNLVNITIGKGVRSIGNYAFVSCTSLSSVSMADGLTNIGSLAFNHCLGLTNLIIPNSVINLGSLSFAGCHGLIGLYFEGNAPTSASDAFSDSPYVIAYYLPGTLGWGSLLAGRPTAPWLLPYPLILKNGPMFGVKTNRFGFIISWATNIPVVVEASADLATHVWSPVSTNALASGWSYFSDPQWSSYPARFYRVRSP
jgi:hypothetical protein